MMQNQKQIWNRFTGLNLSEVINENRNMLFIALFVVIVGVSCYLLGRTYVSDSGNTVNTIREQLNEGIVNQSRITEEISDSIRQNQELRGTIEETERINSSTSSEVNRLRKEIEAIGDGFSETDKLISESKRILREVRESGGEEKK